MFKTVCNRYLPDQIGSFGLVNSIIVYLVEIHIGVFKVILANTFLKLLLCHVSCVVSLTVE